MMNWTALDTWIVVIAALTAFACALPGCFLVLRQMSLMGDAISHAVLPGLAVAFLWTGSRSSLAMFAGAAVVGVLTAVATQWISRFGHVDRGASMGIVFTTLFAVGLVLIVQGADTVDLDVGCVLYGALELTPLDTVFVSGLRMPRAALVLAAVCVLNLATILLFYKELRLSAFDPALARTLGKRPEAMHYVLMVLVAMTAVAAFEAVGSIIVIAMLIVPAATAQLVAKSLKAMLLWSAAIAIFSAAAGHVLALLPPLLGLPGTLTSGSVAVVSGICFAIVALMSGRPKNQLSQKGASAVVT
jgi:manganese/zinc/iron transport system permease protein